MNCKGNSTITNIFLLNLDTITRGFNFGQVLTDHAEKAPHQVALIGQVESVMLTLTSKISQHCHTYCSPLVSVEICFPVILLQFFSQF